MYLLNYFILACFFLFPLSALVTALSLLLYRFRSTGEPGDSPDRTHPKLMQVFRTSAATSGLLLFGWLVSQAIFFNLVKEDIAVVLNHYEPGNSKVYVNNTISSDGPEIVRLLKHPDHRDTTLRPRSNPGERIDIRIINTTDSMVFNLRRDSRTQNEYWIFYDVYRVTGHSHIGKIWSDVLDRY